MARQLCKKTKTFRKPWFSGTIERLSAPMTCFKTWYPFFSSFFPLHFSLFPTFNIIFLPPNINPSKNKNIFPTFSVFSLSFSFWASPPSDRHLRNCLPKTRPSHKWFSRVGNFPSFFSVFVFPFLDSHRFLWVRAMDQIGLVLYAEKETKTHATQIRRLRNWSWLFTSLSRIQRKK